MEPRPTLALIANPGSGSGDSDEVSGLLRSEGADVTLLDCSLTAPEAEAAVRGSVASGASRVVVAGGDGSIAPAAAAAGRHGVPLAVIPAGTANDFVRSHELPGDIEDACRLAVRGQTTRPHDLARVGDRPFVNVASAGLPPVAAREAEGLKARLGPLAYSVGAVRAAVSARPLDCVVECDGDEVHRGGAWQVSVACSGAFGGGAEIDADPRDGDLDLVVIPAGARMKLAWRAYGFRSGRIDRQREVGDRRCSAVSLDAGCEVELNVDGEVITVGMVEFGIEPHAFDLVVS